MSRTYFRALNSLKATPVSYVLKNESGTNTASWPAGMKDVDDQFFNVAYDKADFIVKWNADEDNQRKGVLINGPGAFGVILLLKNGQTAPLQITADERRVIGTIIDETFSGSSAGNFIETKPNTTFTETGGHLQVVKSGGTDYADHLCHRAGVSQLEFTTSTMTTIVQSNDSTSKGMGVGIVGGNPGAMISIVGYVCCDTVNEGVLYLDHFNHLGTWVNMVNDAATATPMVIDVGDNIETSLKRERNTFTLTVNNITKSVIKSVSYTYPTNSAAGVVMPNFYSYALYAIGGTHDVESYAVSSSILMYPEYALAGDSNLSQYLSTDIDHRIASLLAARQKNGRDLQVHAGQSNTGEHLMQLIPDLLRIRPGRVMGMIGTNDLNISVGFAQANVLNWRLSLKNNKLTLHKQWTIPPRPAIASMRTAFNDWLKAEFTNIIDIGDPATGDPVHIATGYQDDVADVVALAVPESFN